LTASGPRTPSALRREHAALLFACAYPTDRAEWEGANAGLRRLAGEARALSAASRGVALHNSGIAGTTVSAAFSLATTRWLADRFGSAVTLVSIEADKRHVMAMLDAALDPVEQEVLSEQPLGWVAWQRRHLGAGTSARLRRLLRLVERLPGGPAEQEAVFASLRVSVRWATMPDDPLLTRGRFARGDPWFHSGGLQRRALPGEAWREGKPRRLRLTADDQHALVDLARGTLAALLGETDPFTYADPHAVELHDVGHGIQVALFTTVPARKLPLEAYVGYLLLKNQVPVAYGGGWVLGRQARFGLNVLPPFRGGESAVVLAQLLRTYAWRFSLKLFLVEPYQLGRGNPDGIRSGAFWFYWRLGFRPRQPELRDQAEREAARLGRGTGRRTPAPLLRRLAESVMAWETPLRTRWAPLDIGRIGARVSEYVLGRFDGDRAAARRSAVRELGLRDPRLAVLLAAVAPPGGWRAADLSRLDRIMRLKGREELRQAVALGRHQPLMRVLARASASGLPGA